MQPAKFTPDSVTFLSDQVGHVGRGRNQLHLHHDCITLIDLMLSHENQGAALWAADPLGPFIWCSVSCQMTQHKEKLGFKPSIP